MTAKNSSEGSEPAARTTSANRKLYRLPPAVRRAMALQLVGLTVRASVEPLRQPDPSYVEVGLLLAVAQQLTAGTGGTGDVLVIDTGQGRVVAVSLATVAQVGEL